MEKTLLASIVAFVFVVLTVLLIVARLKKWVPDSVSKILVDVLTIVGGFAAVAALIIAIPSMPDTALPPTDVPPPTKMPTPTATRETPPPTGCTPFFSDEFKPDHPITDTWTIAFPDRWRQQGELRDGKVYFSLENQTDEWAQQTIGTKLMDFSVVELELAVIRGSEFGAIGFNTNCPGQEGSLVVQFWASSKITGEYETSTGRKSLNWTERIQVGSPYTLRLERENSEVIATLINSNGEERTLGAFPCEGMGPNLNIGVGASYLNNIEGYVESVKVCK
jgi:hypothetical protein